ncbi:MAG: hypothetical protein KIS67_27490 [Verrucomicrobiae bacterium]|nr:hypothetical protein [Verrucomicrobiae bacterium]
MKPTSTPTVSCSSSEYRWLGVLLAFFFITPVLLVLGVTSYFRLNSDTRALRSSLVEASQAEWQPQLSLNLGSLTCGAIRYGLSSLPLEPEAHAAVQAVRRAEVSLLRLAPGSEPADRAAMLEATDAVMSRRGWDRVVGVREGNELVAVYVSAKTTSFRRMESCMVVLTGEQLIVASARANLQPLLDCVLNERGLHARLRLPADLAGAEGEYRRHAQH